MNLRLQSNNISLDYLRAAGHGMLQIGAHHPLLFNVFTMTHDTKFESSNTRKLHFQAREDGPDIVYLKDVGELPAPIIEWNKKHGLKPDSFALRSTDYQGYFGLGGMGIGAEAIVEHPSHADIVRMAAVDFGRSMLDLPLNGIGISDNNVESQQSHDSPYDNEQVDFVFDSRYMIAAFETFKDGIKIPLLDTRHESGELQKLKHSADDQADMEHAYRPMLNAGFANTRFQPLYCKEVAELAEVYYRDGVPDAYKIYERVIPISHLVMQLLEDASFDVALTQRIERFVPGKTYRAFIKPDKKHGGTILCVSDGEQVEEFQDLNMTNPLQTPFTIVDDSVFVQLAHYGYQPENMLDWFKGLRPNNGR